MRKISSLLVKIKNIYPFVFRCIIGDSDFALIFKRMG